MNARYTTATVTTSEHTCREADATERFAALPPAVVNALVEQRDTVVWDIAHAADLEELRAAVLSFRLVGILWHQLGYGYKAAEIRGRILTRAAELANSERIDAAGMSCRARRQKEAAYLRADALEKFAASL